MRDLIPPRHSADVGAMQRIPTLDGWRAVAIAAVVLHHAAMGFYTQEAAYWNHSRTLFGAFGVDIFFGLSGFLITRILLEEWDTTGAVSLRAFYIRRAFRILPPYLFLLAALTAAGLWRSPQEIAGCLLFFRNYVPDPLVSPATQHLWSLAVEEHFYFIWPGLLVWVGRRKGKNVAAWLALAVGLWRMVESQAGLGLFAHVPPHFRTDLRLDALLWGCVVAFLVAGEPARSLFTRQMRFGPWVAAAGAALLCIEYYSMATSVVLALLIPAVVAGTAVHPEWGISRLLDLSPIRWIGRISYGLYLWQQLFLVPGWGKPAHWWLVFPANVAVTVALATASYYLIEKPALALGRRWAAVPARVSVYAN